jgi:branched-chain amino acid transport system substrate-binding protein
LKVKKIAVLHDKGDYGKGLAEFAKDFPGSKIRVPKSFCMKASPQMRVDYSAVVQKIKRQKADAVIFGGYHPGSLQNCDPDAQKENENLLHFR